MAFCIHKVLILVGTVICAIGLLADGVAPGTEGFGMTRMAVTIVGLSLIACLQIWRISRLSHRTLYAITLAIILFGIWWFTLYPASWGIINPFRASSLRVGIVVLSHLSVFFLALLAAGVGVWGELHRIKKTVWGHVALFSLSILAPLIGAEMFFRVILFSNVVQWDGLRQPNFYADYFSDDDYWKLHQRWFNKFPLPKQPHPLLGWGGDFDSDTYTHNQTHKVHKRRPVLLYGDSFAQCVTETCFQDILNSDKDFSQSYYVLNYGVGGYGVDQIFLLLQNSVYQYDDPFVIVSLMTFDLDRSILSFRVGQKPYFQIENGELALCGVPIESDPEKFLANSPLQITSYVYRKILYGTFLPENLIAFLRRESELIRKKIEINQRILLELIKELRTANIDFIFLIFHPHWPEVSCFNCEDDWRDTFLKNFLHDNEVPYIWSKDIFNKDVHARGGVYSFDEYIFPEDGHPTPYFNQLIADEIKKAVLEFQEKGS